MAGFAAVRNYSCNLSLPHHKTLGYSLIIRALRILQGGPKKVYDFATVRGRKVCDMSEGSKFCPEKNTKLRCQ